MVRFGSPRRRQGPHFSKSARSGASIIRALRDGQGAALVEFAITLPLLVVFVVGIYDFSGAFNQKQKIAQAAQEGAIIAGAQPVNDMYATNGNPDSLQPVVTSIFNLLAASKVLPKAKSGTCIVPATGVYQSGLIWKYTVSGCPDDLIITINRGWAGTPGPPVAVGAVVQVSYPYHWRFNSVIQLLFPGAGYAATTTLTETSTTHSQN